jgi:hypothetical protein
MRKPALMLAYTTTCCLAAGSFFLPLGLQANRTLHAAEIPAAFAGEESPTDAKVTSAAEIQLMFYEGLVKRGVPPVWPP